MMRNSQKKLNELVREVMDQIHERKCGKKISGRYRSSFYLFMSISHDMEEDGFSERLIEAFLSSPVNCSEKWARKEQVHRQHCIRLLSSLAQTGTVDWGGQNTRSISEELKIETFQSELERFIRSLEQEGFSPNTIGGYKRIVTYFLLFCQKAGMGS